MESSWPAPEAGDGGIWIPSVDVEETDDAWVVEAELPGVKREDVDIEVRGNEISITGEVKERERDGVLRRKERRTGRFEYRIEVPGEADANGADASMRDGVLTLRIPKAEESQARRIEVGGDESSNGGGSPSGS
jgi:HSP20 family protein